MKMAKNIKKCKKCGNELNGVMIFYPELCLECVIKKENILK